MIDFLKIELPYKLMSSPSLNDYLQSLIQEFKKIIRETVRETVREEFQRMRPFSLQIYWAWIYRNRLDRPSEYIGINSAIVECNLAVVHPRYFGRLWTGIQVQILCRILLQEVMYL